MKYLYFDGHAGLSGDMILGALLDLGISPSIFLQRMEKLQLPVEIQIKEASRASLRALKVDVKVREKNNLPRTWKDLEKFIKKSGFSAPVRENSLAIFKRLYEAEALVHGKSFEETHLHEAAADDALVDIVGTCFLAEELKIKEFYSSPLNVGQGWVKTSHGVLPVPPPAVTELLKGIPVYSEGPEAELVTPTGAAIVATLARKFLPFPEIAYEKTGCGAGEKDFPGFPNILRVFYGSCHNFNPGRENFIIEANIDDSSPEVLANFIDRALELGAKDATLTPIFMKKNRMAAQLTLLAEVDKIDSLMEAVFRETSSIGVRYYPVRRRVLERKLVKVKVLGEDVSVKVAYFGNERVNAQPEFSDCLRLAKKKKLPVKKILQLALAEYMEKDGR